jgi:hypothetical protein
LSFLTLYHGSHEIVKQLTFGLGNATMIMAYVFTRRNIDNLQESGLFFPVKGTAILTSTN